MKRTGSHIVWESIINEGIDTVFGYPGGAVIPLYDALMEYPIHHVRPRHEQGAAHMADGFARASGKVGVAVATSGPGATNLVTGIATAMLDSSPTVFITGQVSPSAIGSDAFQEVDMTGVTLPITKHNYLVLRAEDVNPILREAFYLARSGRPGPVLVDITKEAQIGEVDFEPDTSLIRLPGYRPDLQALPKMLENARELIEEAKKPLILAGHGVLMSGAMQQLQKFVEHTQIPIAMTLLGLGVLPASHPLNLGLMGMHGESWVNNAIQEADLLLAFGMRFDDRVTGTLDTYAPNAHIIHVDIDPSEINKVVKADVGIVGDLKMILEKMLPVLPEMKHDEWLKSIRDQRDDSAVNDIQQHLSQDKLSAAHVIHDIWRYTNGQATIVTDVGQHQMWAAQYYHQEQPYKFITSGGLGTMGFGLPAAIGAWFANPENEVWAIVGDGGFQMTASELSTCAQEGVKINVAIINNGFLGMVRQWQEFFYQRRYSATPINGPDFVKLAEAHGLEGFRIEQRDQVEDAVHRARKAEGTVVIDFRVIPEESVYPMVPAGAALNDMIRRPKPAMEPRGAV